MKTIIVSVMLILASNSRAQTNSSDVIGRILNLDGKPLENVKVYIQFGETQIKAKTDEFGKFKLSAVGSGNSELIAVNEYDTTRREVIVPMDGVANIRDWKIGSKEYVVQIGPPLININPGVPVTIDAEEIKRSPNIRNPAALVASYNSDIQVNEDGDLIIRGSRAGDVVYMIDGVRINNIAAIPGAAMKGITVYSGAIPAKYGDTTGGVVILESKGYFDLLREWNRTQN